MMRTDVSLPTITQASQAAGPVQGLRIVVMGVCGAGKSTVGQALAAALKIDFVEGDALHPPGNLHTMASGTPLTDADRLGWLEAVARHLADVASFPRGVVISCSALKLSYRNLLRSSAPNLQLVYLQGSAQLLEQRLLARGVHFMPPSLLRSQLETLEAPSASENAVTLSISLGLPELVSAAVRLLRRA